jgi:SAM-dependent methyltransferase
MATMPALLPARQTGPDPHAWFRSDPGRAVLDSERDTVAHALTDRPGLPWLWCGPVAQPVPESAGRGLCLHPDASGQWSGPVACALPLPLPSEAFGAVVLQHVARPSGPCGADLLDEAARLLVNGGRLWLFVLNPLAPYRWRWRGSGLTALEPLSWRKRLRHAGLAPEPVSQGLGPTWGVQVASQAQQGAGLRAGYLLRAEKRAIPLTPVRQRRALPMPSGAAAA